MDFCFVNAVLVVGELMFSVCRPPLFPIIISKMASFRIINKLPLFFSQILTLKIELLHCFT